MSWQRKKHLFTITENQKYTEIDSINSGQSSLKSYPLWVTLYIHDLFTKDHYSGADFAKKEVQDDHGVVTGEYR